ncbi:MAG: hypothetical protein Q4P07_13395 [Ornithinimicrobium sp.]|uniref:AMIN-like domain-containing (lipo)protein n=1 Tax=Ornithinimicrobium sp. TaxID=1977084 RepID=UPI0026DF2948|nr:hypothetical protein [Ornithinimicrobium sp.]MDO5741131.1 hypothetical protein [Ornithinimicrobium sp.]
MSTRNEFPGHPSDSTEPSALEVREALAGPAIWDAVTGVHSDLDVDGYWARGRRRRSRKRVGAVSGAGLAVVSAIAIAWSSGLMGGATSADQSIAAVPDGLTTFAFAPVGGADSSTGAAVTVPSVERLRGTTWVLQKELWGSDRLAVDVIGAAPEVTKLIFGAGDPGHLGWGLAADDCGSAWFQENLTLSADGRFPAGDLATDDQGCPQPAQAAEDFWMEALQEGGTLQQVGDGGWLLLSVNPAVSDHVAPTDPSTVTDAPVSSAAPAASAGTSDAPSVPAAPTDSTAPPATIEPPPSSPAPDDAGAPGFTAADQEATHGNWLSAGGDLLAPTVRAGAHEGYDRIVVDLTGTGALGWRAAYADNPSMDGSGQAVEIAGDQVLELWLSGMGYPQPGSPVYSEGTFMLDTHSLGTVVEVMRTTPFEGRLQVFIGMNGDRRPYRVFELESPRRLVIDVQQ